MAKVQPGSFPLVVFSDGLSWPGILYQSLVEDLASRGYAVVVVTHSHGAAITRYPDGRFVAKSRWPDFKDTKQEDWFLARRSANWAVRLRDLAVGPTKHGKGMKIIGLADDHSLPLAVSIESASPHESQLVEGVLGHSFLNTLPARLIGDKVTTATPWTEIWLTAMASK